MAAFVTGIGIVTALGIGAERQLNAFESHESGIRKDTVNDFMCGRFPWSNEAIIQQCQLPQKDYSRTTLLSVLAARECWAANVHDPGLRTGMVSATSAGGLDKMEHYYLAALQDPDFYCKPFMVFDNGGVTQEVAAALGIRGMIDTVSTACSSGANAIMHGARMLEHGLLDRVLVGGADPITVFNLKGFNALMVYDHAHCKPFDAGRKGMNLGEGAAFLLLENERSLKRTKNRPICTLDGWFNATDAYHQTASSPEGVGAVLTMNGAMKKAGITANQVSYINAHGTGTENNDLSESRAFVQVFGHKMPPFSSTKGFTGHTLAAAGAIEAVFCVLSLQHQVLIPNYNFSAPMPETGLVPVTGFQKNAGIQVAMTNSFGFGGNCTSLLFKALS